jgi:hypothetical protein
MICRASIALNARRADRRRTRPLERPCELLAEFLEPRVAPVRSAGSPVAGLKLRQKIVHRCSETKTFYVSTRSQKCLERRRGARRPAGRLQQVRVDRLAHACAKGYRAFCGWWQVARRTGRKRLHLAAAAASARRRRRQSLSGRRLGARGVATTVSTALRSDSCFLGKPPPQTVTEFDLAKTRVPFWEAMGYTPGLFLKEWVKC